MLVDGQNLWLLGGGCAVGREQVSRLVDLGVVMIYFRMVQAATANNHRGIGQEQGPGMVYSGSGMASRFSPRLRGGRVNLRNCLESFMDVRLAPAHTTDDKGFAVGKDYGGGKYALISHRGPLFRFHNGARFYVPKRYFECVGA